MHLKEAFAQMRYVTKSLYTSAFMKTTIEDTDAINEVYECLMNEYTP